MYTESEILGRLDFVYKKATDYEDILQGSSDPCRYYFFLDLEHGYYDTAGTRIHLYGDSRNWAIVFEKNCFSNRGDIIQIELNYIGNCINLIKSSDTSDTSFSNTEFIELVGAAELKRIENRDGEGMEAVELVDAAINEILIRDQKIAFNQTEAKQNKIYVSRDWDNPRGLMGFADIARYLNETNPTSIAATEAEITEHFSHVLPKIMSIDEFHFESIYANARRPSEQETYRLLAKILVSKDPNDWQPTQAPNNHWSNWESGNL